jgi:hypothetical protein
MGHGRNLGFAGDDSDTTTPFIDFRGFPSERDHATVEIGRKQTFQG